MPARPLDPSPPWVRLLRFLDRTRWWWFAGLAALYLAGFNGQWRATPDSALHLDAARLWVEDGTPVVDPELLGKVQPGLGLVIAAPAAIGLVSTDAPQAARFASFLMLGFAAAVLALTYRLLLLHADRPTAVLTVLLVGTNAQFYEMGFNLLTEIPFAAGLLLVLWGHERRLKRPGRLASSLGLMAVGVGLMAVFRSVAAVVVGAYLLAELVRVVGRRDQRRLGLALLGFAGGAGAALAWGVPAIRQDAVLFGQTLGSLDPERLLINTQELANAVLPEAFLGQAVPPPISWPLAAAALAAGSALLRRRLLWAVLVGVFVLQWLVFLADLRYVLPLLPLWFYGGWSLLIAVCHRLPRRPAHVLFGLVVFCVLTGNLIGVGHHLRQQRSPDFYAAYRHGKYVPVRALARALTERALPEEVVLTSHRVWAEMAVWSKRRVIGAPDRAGRALQGGDWVVLPLSEMSSKQLAAAGLSWGPAVAESGHGEQTWTLHRLVAAPATDGR